MRKVVLPVDTILTGRVAYQSFEGFWPAAATDPSSPPDLAELATWMLDTPKVVFSTTLDKVEMESTRLATAGIAEEVGISRGGAAPTGPGRGRGAPPG